MLYIYKILRITAWLLVVATLFILFSGFLTTKFFLAPWLGYSASYYIHTIIAPLVFVPLFYFHSLAGLIILISRDQLLNKRIIKIIAVILWTGVFASFIYLYEAKNSAVKTGDNSVLQNQSIMASSTISNSKGQNTQSVSLTEPEIGKHNRVNDCWMIISGKVYNLTNYLSAHPGGVETMTPYCGGDGTSAFNGKPHSGYASSLLNSYYIGNVGSTSTAQTIQSANNIPAPARGKGNNDREDD